MCHGGHNVRPAFRGGPSYFGVQRHGIVYDVVPCPQSGIFNNIGSQLRKEYQANVEYSADFSSDVPVRDPDIL